ncbi:MAG: glycosyltransferase, partial [Balneolaceae bacterium]|nr:glycosyltransferase [Balneolaceae bacterium]
MIDLLSLFLSDGYDVTFACAASRGEHAADLESMGITPVAVDLNSSTFDDFIYRLNPDVVVFDRFITEEQFGWRVADHAPRCVRILDTEDLHFLRRARGRAVREERAFHESDVLDEPTAIREIASMLRSDLSLIISEYEMELLLRQFDLNAALLHYLPFHTEGIDPETADAWPDYPERDGFVMIGNFSHAPNRDAVCYLKQELWPGIRARIPQATVHMYGAYPSDEVLSLHNEEEGFLVKGRVDDARKAVRKAR